MKRPLLCCAFCLALLTALVHGRAPDRADNPPWDRQTVTVAGTICEKDATSFLIKIQKESFRVEGSSMDATDLWQQISNEKIVCAYEEAEQLILYSQVLVEGRMEAFSPATNPGEFDYAAYYHSLGYAGRMRQVRILAMQGKKPGLAEWLYGVRSHFEERLYQVFPPKEASILAAMLLGDKAGVDADVKELYRRSGIIHILSISGLHITLLGVGLYKRLRGLGVPVWGAAVAGSILLVLYGLMTGFGVSACRAIVMYLLRMLAQILGRTYDMLTALGVAAAILLCVHPAWITHMGFLLSFTSVLGVGALFPVLQGSGQADRRGKLRRYVEGKWRKRICSACEKGLEQLRQGLLAGCAITATTLPVQLWFSYEVPVYALFLNVCIIPFMQVVMVAGIIAMAVPGLGIVGTLDVWILNGYEALCLLAERLPHPMWNPGRPAIWQMVLYYLIWMSVIGGSGFYAQWCKRKKMQAAKQLRREKILRVSCIVALLGGVCLLGISRGRVHQITFLDVGQGDGICVQLATGEVYLFDCGSSSRKHVGEQVLIPFLKYYGIDRSDGMFISHADADHVNGLLELLQSSKEEHIQVAQVILPQIEPSLRQEEFREIYRVIAEMDRPPDIAYICAGIGFTGKDADDVSFLCLHPCADGQGSGGNAGSECFLIRFGSQSVLLTGDVEGTGERQLLVQLQERGICNIALFKCAHHGSAGTNSEALLGQLAPRCTVISCGRNNPYGHPHREVLERLAEMGSLTVQTPEAGAVTVRVRQGRMECIQFR